VASNYLSACPFHCAQALKKYKLLPRQGGHEKRVKRNEIVSDRQTASARLRDAFLRAILLGEGDAAASVT